MERLGKPTTQQADAHYRAVIRALVAEALELSTFLEKVSHGTNDLRSKTETTSEELDQLQFSDWVSANTCSFPSEVTTLCQSSPETVSSPGERHRDGSDLPQTVITMIFLILKRGDENDESVLDPSASVLTVCSTCFVPLQH